ncbi:uncharacterized protein LOC130955342 isoform X1 [Arachis stenosperma]|uniref:uncharacterized protein LOC130955342 isoform X1 n=2 Tax=Arachis stenosperma TaxID=217475 RepID=UPI0025AD1F62|nr:uncharacterized protein LOC130955342 isoform X1 [Arachis stenosperma]XP_057738165.1 uncharacterized protein LOC130955342 isoform X1 [Arachis stenosperma]
MTSKSYFVVVHHCGEIIDTIEGTTFSSKNPIGIFINSTTSYADLQDNILQKLDQFDKKRVSEILYRLPISFSGGHARYQRFPIRSDSDMQVLFYCQSTCPEIRTIELFVRIEEIFGSSGGSAPNVQSRGMEGSSGSGPLLVRSPSFAVYNNQNVNEGETALGDSRSSGRLVLETIEPPTQHPPNHEAFVEMVDVAEDVIRDEDEESVNIPYDSDDNQGNDPLTQTQRSNLETQHYPSHFSALNLSAMQQVDVDLSGFIKEGEFVIGQRFRSKDEAVLAIKNYNIRRAVEYKVLESDHRKYCGKCRQSDQGCNWLIRVSLRQKKRYWEVRKYNGRHTCLAINVSRNHRQLDYHVVCSSIFPMVQADPTISIKLLQNSIEGKFGFRCSYRKAWLAKQKAIAKIYGDWEESYNLLPRWILGIQMTMPGSFVMMKTAPVRVEGVVDPSRVIFHRLFWTFSPCVEAFKHCKPVISIDGTLLYGKYGGMLMIAIAQDGNSNILPVAFALVEGENIESWKFFLTHMREQVTPQPGILVISDNHPAIQAALNAEGSGWHPPSAYRAFCIRHLAANFALNFKSKDARRALVNAAYAKTGFEFQYYFELMKSENSEMCTWANRCPLELWTQHRDEGRRYGHMITNLSECVNDVLKGIRNLPITSLVRSTYYRLAELFVSKGKEAEAQLAAGQQFSHVLTKAIEKNREASGQMNVHLYDRENLEFTVSEAASTGGYNFGAYRVSLKERRCDCGYFQALHYPCKHVLIACASQRIDWTTYVDSVYRMSSVFNVYKMVFSAPPHEDHWPMYEGPRVVPDPSLMRATQGRPPSTRLRKNMDEFDEGQPKRCGLCRQPGHTRSKCLQNQASSSSHAGSNG